MGSRRSALVPLAISMALLGSCGLVRRLPESTPDPEQVARVWQAEDYEEPRRVAVIEFRDTTGNPGPANQITVEMGDALRRHHGFDVIPAAVEDNSAARILRERGLIPRATLVTLAREHRADAVLFGTVTHFRGYEPLLVGLEVALVATTDGRVLWTSQGVFDATDRAVSRDVHNYHDTELAKVNSLEGWRRLLVSPAQFARYACERMASPPVLHDSRDPTQIRSK